MALSDADVAIIFKSALPLRWVTRGTHMRKWEKATVNRLEPPPNQHGYQIPRGPYACALDGLTYQQEIAFRALLEKAIPGQGGWPLTLASIRRVVVEGRTNAGGTKMGLPDALEHVDQADWLIARDAVYETLRQLNRGDVNAHQMADRVWRALKLLYAAEQPHGESHHAAEFPDRTDHSEAAERPARAGISRAINAGVAALEALQAADVPIKPYLFFPSLPEAERILFLVDSTLQQLGAVQLPDGETSTVEGHPTVAYEEVVVGGPKPIEGLGAALFVRILRMITDATYAEGVGEGMGPPTAARRLHWSWRVTPEVATLHRPDQAYARLAIFWAVPAGGVTSRWQWVRRIKGDGTIGGWEVAQFVPARRPDELTVWMCGPDMLQRDGIKHFGDYLEPPA